MNLTLEQITEVLNANKVKSFYQTSSNAIIINDAHSYDALVKTLDVIPEVSANLNYKVFEYVGWEIFGPTKL